MTEMTLTEAASSGNRLASLEALRDSLAADISACESMRDKAALGRLFADVLGQIADVEKAEPQQEGTPLDEFTRRRAAKTSTAGKAGSARGRK